MKSLKHITWDNVKTAICIAAIALSGVAYLRSDAENWGLLKNQHSLEEKVDNMGAYITILASKGRGQWMLSENLEIQVGKLRQETEDLREVVLWVKKKTEEGDDTTW